MNSYLSDLEPLALVVNPETSTRKWQKKKKARNLIEANFKNKIFIATGGKQATVDLVQKISPDLKTLIVVGGDGTIADVLEGLSKAGCLSRVNFGLIPLGSGNAFCRAFDIPMNISRAIETIHQGHLERIDLIGFEDKVAGFVSVGATAYVTEIKSDQPFAGFWGHVWAGRKILQLKPKLVQITLEEASDRKGNKFARLELEVSVLDTVIAKTGYFGYNWLIAPFADPGDGWLDVTFFEMSGLHYILSLPAIYFGQKQKNLRHFKTRRLTLKGENLPIQYNGEFLGRRNQITFEVLPKVLKLICPIKKNNSLDQLFSQKRT